MTLTSANFDYLLLRRARKKMAYAGLDAVTADGTNQDLLDGKLEGLRSLGGAPLSPVAVTDADLAGVADRHLPQLVDVAELRTLENILGNRASPDQMADTDNQQWHGKFYDSLEATIARKRKQCERQYGYGLSSLSGGRIGLDFAERFRDADLDEDFGSEEFS